MGNIIVGQKNPKRFDGGLLTVAEPNEQPKVAEQGQEMTDEMKRENRLKEILAMDESEQQPLLLADGYEEEAKELSEKLAELNGGTVESGDGDEPDAAGTAADDGEADSEPKTEKKTTRTKK